jgi:deoxyribodipyrimidine photo-lyase
MKNSIYIFQRALRLDDNLGLIECLHNSDNVYPIFCVDPRQATDKNLFLSPFALGFMLQSLQDLDNQLKKYDKKLCILYGEPHDVLKSLILKHKINNIYTNKDYTPFARQRATELQQICNIIEIEDYLLFPEGSIKTTSGKAYRVYTPFLRETERKKVKKPIKMQNSLAKKIVNLKSDKKALTTLNKFSKILTNSLNFPGGRQEALNKLNNLIVTQKHYDKCRDYLTYNTTNLSAYIKFGCVSIREIWEAFGKISDKSSKLLKRQLLWREFYYHYYIDFPESLEWDKKLPEAKLDSNAPDIVKACYNQLNETGFLHNRGRMILAHYLLHSQKIYWKSCDKMYATRLVDYDPIVNIGNWNFIKKQPKFKWLKPEVQYKKWDKGCPYTTNNIEPGDYTKMYTS